MTKILTEDEKAYRLARQSARRCKACERRITRDLRLSNRERDRLQLWPATDAVPYNPILARARLRALELTVDAKRETAFEVKTIRMNRVVRRTETRSSATNARKTNAITTPLKTQKENKSE